MREKDVEKLLIQEVKKRGGRAYKWVSPGNAGVPDRIVIFPDRPPVFVELKADSGRLTKLQEVQIRRLESLGQAVFVARGASGVDELIRALESGDPGSGKGEGWDGGIQTARLSKALYQQDPGD